MSLFNLSYGWTLDPKLVRIVLDRENQMLSVTLIGNENIELVKLYIDNELPSHFQENNWSYYHLNNAITYSIKEVK